MENLDPSPLCRQSDIQVYRPSIDYFIQKIRQREFFVFTRQMHGLWDAVIAAWILRSDLRAIRLADKYYIQELTLAMSEVKKIIEDIHYEPDLYAELLEILKNLDGEDSSFMFGISDTSFFPDSPPSYLPNDFWLPNKCVFKLLPTKDHLSYFKLRFVDRQNVIRLLTPSDYPFYDAMIWKQYAYNNDIWKLFEEIKDHPVVLVGPGHYHDFGTRTGLADYFHIKIHGSHASVNRNSTMDQIIQKHHSLSSGTKPPIYFFVAGSVAVYWVCHLHKKLKNKYLIDVGQAFNFLYDSRSALLHREFGFSSSADKGRRAYSTKNQYGSPPIQSFMKIADDQVTFDLNLKLKDYWLELLIGATCKHLINIQKIRRKFLQMKNNFYSFISKG